MTGRTLLAAAVAISLLPGAAGAQGVRGRASTNLSLVQFRQVVLDSVPAASVAGEGARRVLADGTRARCDTRQCWFYRSGATVDVVPLIQDVELNAWGGIPGLRAYAYIRLRKPLGEGALWPRSDKEFDPLAAYLEYSRPELRARAGRLWRTSALGFYNFDGVDLMVRLPAGVRVHGFAGLSLLRGTDERHTGELLAAVEPFPPDEDAYLLGVETDWRPLPGVAGSVVYQRELRTDRAALYSERIAADAHVLVEGASITLAYKYDLASGATNEARFRVAVPVGTRWSGAAELRRYRPYFDLWTIWGAFAPVGFREARLQLAWNGGPRASAQLAGAYRDYGDTDADVLFIPIESEGWRVHVDGRLSPLHGWSLDASYQLELGFGATRNGIDLALQRTFGDRGWLAVRGAAFQNISEFRVGEGRVLAAGGDAGLELAGAQVRAGGTIYRHTFTDRPRFLDWNQLRGYAALEIPIGRDPGLPRRAEP